MQSGQVRRKCLTCGAEDFADGQRFGHHRRLIGATQSEPRPRVELERRDVAPVEHDPAVVRGVTARQHFEQRGLARAIRSDHAQNLSHRDAGGDTLQDRPAAQADMDVLARKERRGAGSSFHYRRLRRLTNGCYVIQGAIRNFASASTSGWMILCCPSCTWKKSCAMPLLRSLLCSG